MDTDGSSEQIAADGQITQSMDLLDRGNAQTLATTPVAHSTQKAGWDADRCGLTHSIDTNDLPNRHG